jgi:hypothetical protein
MMKVLEIRLGQQLSVTTLVSEQKAIVSLSIIHCLARKIVGQGPPPQAQINRSSGSLSGDTLD